MIDRQERLIYFNVPNKGGGGGGGIVSAEERGENVDSGHIREIFYLKRWGK
jgi:hypothetical protein